MKKILTLCFLLCSFSGFAQNAKPFVIPELQEWHGSTGTFELTDGCTIVVPKEHSAELMPIAKQFAEELQVMFGIKATAKIGNAKNGDISLSINPAAVDSKNEEAYMVNIGKSVAVDANAPIGVIWATRTLLQMAEGSLSLSCGTITDYPAYAKRGFMLDVGRKFFSMDYLQSIVKIMSYYKMNTFQVHLNDCGFKEFFDDDWSKTYSAFRLESETFPGLAAKDGHYTKAEFREFQKEAIAQGVLIIPEIDAPAHTLAFSKYLPEIASKNYGDDHLELFSPKTYEFLDALFAEYISGEDPVFVGDYVHIGTDEYSNKDSLVVEKFRYFTDYYIKHVEKFGKKAALWGALTHAKGSTPVKIDSVLMNCWYNGYAEPRDMIAAGYDVLSVPDDMVYIVPEAGYYNDYLDIEKIYNTWTPAMIGKEIFDEGHPKIKGGMFAVWNDLCGNGISFQDVHHRVMPALQTMACKLWDGKNVSLPFAEFDSQRATLSEAPGINIMARVAGGKKGEVLFIESPATGQSNSISDIGYNYRVEFDITIGANSNGTVLFESPYSKFYLSDIKEGKMGYSRDGYNYTFNYVLPQYTKTHIAIEGTNKATTLFVDGKLVETLGVKFMRQSPSREHMKMHMVQTLVFPLAKIGNFYGSIENLRVTAL